LAADPDAEVKPAMNLWNDANTRHQQLMHLLMTFPGIVIVTARGKEVASLDDSGRPIVGSKEHKVEAQKDLAFDVTAWVSLSRDDNPKVMGVRSVHAGVRPGVDKPVTAPQFSLEWLIFDVLKCDPVTAQVRDFASPEELVTDLLESIGQATSRDELTQLWGEAKSADVLAVGLDGGPTVRDALATRAEAIKEPDHDAAQATLTDALGAEEQQ
jgi:hypothetical protein